MKRRTNNKTLMNVLISVLTYLKRQKYQIGIISIFIAGFLLRLYPAFTRWFWEDELATISFALSPYSWVEQFLRPMDDRPPLFYLIIRFFIKFTQNEFLLRLPIILFSILSIYILFKTAERFGKKVALIILVIVTFSLFHIEYSWQLRDYGLLMLPTSVVFYYFVQYVEQLLKTHTVSRWTLLGMTIAFYFGCMVNYIFVIFVICMISLLVIVNQYFVYKRKEKHYWSFLREFLMLQLPLVLTLVYYLSRQLSIIQQTTEWIPKASLYSYFLITVVFLGFSNDLYDLYSQDQFLIFDYGIITMGVVTFFILCIYLLKHNKQSISPLINIVFFSGLYVYVVGFIGTVLCSQILGTNIFLMRTFTRIGTMLLISFGLGIYIFIRTLTRKEYVNKLIIFFLFIYISICMRSYIDWYRPSLRDLMGGIPLQKEQQVLNNVYETGDHVLYLPLYYEVLYPFYYWRDDAEKWKSVLLYVKLFGDEKYLYPEPYQRKLNTDMFHLRNVQLNDKQGKIILLNWNIQNWKTEKIYSYCRDIRNSDFEVIYKTDVMYVAICE